MPLPMFLETRFPLGQLVYTPSLTPYLVEIQPLLRRHANCDWGDLDDEDKAANDINVNNGGRLLSAYTMKDSTRIWIITEHDRSVTTILRPEEY